VVCADWGVITDVSIGEIVWPARAWGVEHLDELARVQAALDAGIDQFGGERCPEYVAELVRTHRLSEQRVDVSLRRILRQKFQLGLFDYPYVDVDESRKIVGKESARQLGFASQMRAMTLLKNAAIEGIPTLPLKATGLKIYVDGIQSDAVIPYATVVDDPGDADLAIVRREAPWYAVDTANPFAQGFHHGDLDFQGEEKQRLLDLMATVPTVFVIYLDRPAVIPHLVQRAMAVVADYGASDRAVAEVLFGKSRPEGRLPFELPSSMSAVRKQLPDLPADSERPLFEIGFGLRYD
jgi:beta-glucosidase